MGNNYRKKDKLWGKDKKKRHNFCSLEKRQDKGEKGKEMAEKEQ